MNVNAFKPSISTHYTEAKRLELFEWVTQQMKNKQKLSKGFALAQNRIKWMKKILIWHIMAQNLLLSHIVPRYI